MTILPMTILVPILRNNISRLPQGPDGALGRLANMQELVGKLGGGDLVGKNFGGGDLVGKNLNNIVGNLWKQQEEGSGSSHGNMVSSNQYLSRSIGMIINILRQKLQTIRKVGRGGGIS